MERLTKKDEFGNAEFVGIDNAKLYERLVCDETVALTIATNKLGELEDVLEKYGIDNLDEFIKEYSSRNIKLANDNYALEQELADLQHRLEVAERATKLACNELRALNYRTFDNAGIDFEQQFKEQAEAEINKRSNNDE